MSDIVVLEVDIATGNVLFEWESLDHVSPHGEFNAFILVET